MFRVFFCDASIDVYMNGAVPRHNHFRESGSRGHLAHFTHPPNCPSEHTRAALGVSHGVPIAVHNIMISTQQCEALRTRESIRGRDDSMAHVRVKFTLDRLQTGKSVRDGITREPVQLTERQRTIDRGESRKVGASNVRGC